MKYPLLILSVAAMLTLLSSCTGYVDGGGYASARPGYRPAPSRVYSSSYGRSHYHNDRHHDSRYDSRSRGPYQRVSQPPSRYRRDDTPGVRVQTNVNTPIVRSGTHIRL